MAIVMGNQIISGTADSSSEFRSVPIVQIANGNWYVFMYSDALGVFFYRKSTTRGFTWGAPVTIASVAVSRVSVWYDQWTSGDSGSAIHIAYLNTTNHDAVYRNLDTSSDTLATAVVVLNGASFSSVATAAVEATITKTRGGNLIYVFDPDNGAEDAAFKAASPYTSFSAIASPSEGGDWFTAYPGNYADNQDADMIYWDRDVNELSLKTYDDSGDSWSEAAIASSMADNAVYFKQYAGVVRHSDGHLIVAAWNAVDVGTADCQTWDINGGASITAKTNLVTNFDDCVGVCLLLDQSNDDVFAFYMGKSDGSQTVGTSVGLYYKKSTDDLTTWGSETTLYDTILANVEGIWCNPSQSGQDYLPVSWAPATNSIFGFSGLMATSFYDNAAGGGGGFVGIIGG